MEKINWLDFREKGNPVLEAYRNLRVNLQNITEKSNIKLIEFTSVSTITDKSIVVAGLAVVLAQSGCKTLIVDVNFAEPTQHDLFGLPNHGLAEAVAGGEIRAEIQHCLEQDNLDILAAGVFSINDNELLLCNKVQQFLEEAKEEYDYILLDVTAMDQSADAIVASSKTDGVVFVVTNNVDNLNALNRAKMQMEEAGAVVLGCVLNKVKDIE